MDKVERQSYLVNYQFQDGQGRIFLSSEVGGVTEETIRSWDKKIAEINGKTSVFVTSFIKLEGPITPAPPTRGK